MWALWRLIFRQNSRFRLDIALKYSFFLACGGLLLFSKSPKLNFSRLLIIQKIPSEFVLEF